MTEQYGKELSTKYDHGQVEKKWYDEWKEKGYFKAPEISPAAGIHAGKHTGDTAGKHAGEPFSIVMPPPNVTGSLHIGHALDFTIQDVLTRFRRMQGRDALWLPGTDHAGIATQAKVEEALAKEGKTKDDLGREAFVEQVWDWKHTYHGRIVAQLGRLGAGCDWSRERFTLDEGCSAAVGEVFASLYEKGLIYRGNYLINWCPKCGTTISDIEVEHEEEDGFLWYIRYPVKDEPGRFLTVATTRPETMLGDTAVAVHPEDERYADLIGKRLVLPLVGRELPVIADTVVDRAFGTGAVKITPAHDINDYETGLRHGLEQIAVLDKTAAMNAKAGKYKGLDREEARKQIVADLEELGLLEKTEAHRHAVGHCYRCGVVVEPMLSEQWFVRMKPLAEPAVAAVKDGRIRFVPARFSKIFLDWMENVRDWCISRQLWWGHRIPVWYCRDCGETVCRKAGAPERCPKCGSGRLEQDPDVLDTWFSSGLWPFSTMGWPEESDDLRYYYPTSVLVTGRDIIFFWVARMAFLGLEFTGRQPFHDVMIHGLVLDELGRKMSKSLGNGVDPIEVIEEYGADTLRFSLLTGNAPGNDMRFQKKRLEGTQNFCNKIWNASRFALMHLRAETGQAEEKDAAVERAETGQAGAPVDAKKRPVSADASALGNVHETAEASASGNAPAPDEAPELADRWIVSRFNRCAADVTKALEEYDLGAAAGRIYEFLWDEFCDWYIELIKPRLYGKKSEASRLRAKKVLAETLGGTLTLLHPFMPFITEELWRHLPHTGESIMLAPWYAGDAARFDEKAEESMALMMETVRAARNLRSQLQIPPGKKADLVLFAANGTAARMLESCLEDIALLAAAEKAELGDGAGGRPRQAVSAVVTGAEVYLPLAGLVDIRAERERLQNAVAKVNGEIRGLEGKLANGGFRQKAPAEVIAKEEEKLGDARFRLRALEDRLSVFAD